jgi:hypothetical protein
MNILGSNPDLQERKLWSEVMNPRELILMHWYECSAESEQISFIKYFLDTFCQIWGCRDKPDETLGLKNS